MATARTGSPSKFMLTLGGVACGFVQSVDGGGIAADVIEVRDGASNSTRKMVSAARYEDVTVQLGLDLGHDVYDWIAAVWSGNITPKDCSIMLGDANLNAKTELRFGRALPTGVTIPALDATSKDLVRLALTMTPEVSSSVKATGKLAGGAAAPTQKKFLASNFRLELDGIDCKGVKRIESFTVQLAVARERDGETRLPRLVGTKLEFPNLHVVLADNTAAESWQTWAHDFIADGNGQERNGAIVMLGPDLQNELARIELHGVGICGLRHSKRDSGTDKVSAFAAELFCERMALQVGKPAPTPVRPVLRPVIDRPTGITPLPR